MPEKPDLDAQSRMIQESAGLQKPFPSDQPPIPLVKAKPGEHVFESVAEEQKSLQEKLNREQAVITHEGQQARWSLGEYETLLTPGKNEFEDYSKLRREVTRLDAEMANLRWDISSTSKDRAGNGEASDKLKTLVNLPEYGAYEKKRDDLTKSHQRVSDLHDTVKKLAEGLVTNVDAGTVAEARALKDRFEQEFDHVEDAYKWALTNHDSWATKMGLRRRSDFRESRGGRILPRDLYTQELGKVLESGVLEEIDQIKMALRFATDKKKSQKWFDTLHDQLDDVERRIRKIDARLEEGISPLDVPVRRNIQQMIDWIRQAMPRTIAAVAQLSMPRTPIPHHSYRSDWPPRPTVRLVADTPDVEQPQQPIEAEPDVMTQVRSLQDAYRTFVGKIEEQKRVLRSEIDELVAQARAKRIEEIKKQLTQQQP